MCGITGIINLSHQRFGVSDKKIFKDLLVATSLRGKHSTGLFTIPIDNSESVKILKRAVTASEFIETNKFELLMKDFSDYKYIVGHTRYATVGEINDKNAHPFVSENIISVHNGSVNNKHEICVLGGKEGSDCEVDSESLAIALSKNSIEDFVSKVEGAFAIVWYDTKEKKLHFIRNTERPLHFGVVKDEDTILFASEAEALYFVAKRNDLELSKIFSLNVGTLLTFDKDCNYEIKKIYDGQPVRPTYAQRYGSWYGNYDDYGSCSPYVGRRQNYVGVDDLFPEEETNNPFAVIGMEKNDEVEFLYDSFEPYNSNSQRGCLVGKQKYYPSREVRVHNYCKSQLPETKGILLSGELISLSKNKKSTEWANKYTLILRDNSIVEFTNENYYDEEDDPYFDDDELCATSKYLANGKYVSEEKFEKLTESGCEVCSCPINSVDDSRIRWTNTNRPICYDCSKSGEYDSHIADTPIHS